MFGMGEVGRCSILASCDTALSGLGSLPMWGFDQAFVMVTG